MKKLVLESLNEQETFLPDYSILSFDWKASGEEIMEALEVALGELDLYITPHPVGEGNDQYVFIISKGPLSDEQKTEIAEDSIE